MRLRGAPPWRIAVDRLRITGRLSADHPRTSADPLRIPCGHRSSLRPDHCPHSRRPALLVTRPPGLPGSRNFPDFPNFSDFPNCATTRTARPGSPDPSCAPRAAPLA
ncbi:hypothetical protein KPATCC21470_5655 [Kitasatospora purpeofusca]